MELNEYVNLAKQQARRLVTADHIGDRLNRSDLANITNKLLGFPVGSSNALTAYNIRDLEQGGLLSAQLKPSGKKTFHWFDKADLEVVVALKVLQTRYQIEFRAAKTAIADAYRIIGTNFESEQVRQVRDESIITGGAPRAQRYIWTRCLMYVFSLLFSKWPDETLFSIEQFSGNDHPSIGGNFMDMSEGSDMPAYTETGENTLVGRITGGSLPFIDPVIRTRDDITYSIRCFAFSGELTGRWYKFTFATPEVPAELTADARQLMVAAGTHQALMVAELLTLSFQRFTMPRLTPPLDAMAEAIVQALPEIDYCGILTPAQMGTNILSFSSYSISFPESLVTAKIDADNLVAGWTYQHRVALFIDDVQASQSYVSPWEQAFTAAAVAPMSLTPGRGVVYALRHRAIQASSPIFDSIFRMLFSMLAAIAGELGESESTLIENERSAVRSIRRGPISVLGPGDLRQYLQDELLALQNMPSQFADRSLYAILISLENVSEIAQCGGPGAEDWISSVTTDIACEIIGRSLLESAPVFRVGKGMYAIVVRRSLASEPRVKQVSTQIKNHIGSIRLLVQGTPTRVECYAWGVYYRYDPYLKRTLQEVTELPSSEAIADSVANRLADRLTGDILTLKLNEQGHASQRRGDNTTAYNCFAEAHSLNPAEPYFPKHMAEQLVTQSSNMARAEELCEISIALDPNYAGAHYMKGEVLMRQARIDAAIIEYLIAIDIQPTAKNHERFATSLAKCGRYDDAIKQFKLAKRIDPSKANLYEYLIARVYILAGRPVDARIRLRGMMFDGDHEFAALLQLEDKLLEQVLNPEPSK